MPDIKAQNETALASVKAIYDAADEANTLLDGMQTAATQAGTTLYGIYATAVQAEESAQDAQTSATQASEYASRALGNLASVQSVTETLNWITAHGTMTLTSDTALDPSHVYFVVDANGDYVVGGTHYSVVSEPSLDDISTYYELSINESLNNYVATHLVVDTEGLWIIPDSGGNKVLIATGSGSTYTTAGTYIVGSGGVILASFTSNGAQIGQNAEGKTRTIVATDGLQILHKNPQGTDIQIAQLGYDSSSINAPYTTLGQRRSGSAIGAYSTAEGYLSVASGDYSHAEGNLTWATGNSSHAEGHENMASGDGSHTEGEGTTASGTDSHAEGDTTTASGNKSHAEGDTTTASGTASHAEGRRSEASGNRSHAEGEGTVASGNQSHAEGSNTIAQRKSQTVLGEYNIADTGGTDATTRGDYAVIVGNGTSSSVRSNGLTVAWDGNVEMALDTTATSGTDKDIYDALVSLGWDSDVIV